MAAESEAIRNLLDKIEAIYEEGTTRTQLRENTILFQKLVRDQVQAPPEELDKTNWPEQAFGLGMAAASKLVTRENLEEIVSYMKTRQTAFETENKQTVDTKEFLDRIFNAGFAYEVAKQLQEKNLVAEFEALSKQMGLNKFSTEVLSEPLADKVESLIRREMAMDNLTKDTLSAVYDRATLEKARGSIEIGS